MTCLWVRQNQETSSSLSASIATGATTPNTANNSTSTANNSSIITGVPSGNPANNIFGGYSQQQAQPLQQQQQAQLSPSPYALSTPLMPPPVANAGVSQIVDANANVVLDGRNSYVPILQQQQQQPSRMIIAYQWTQLPIGVPVIIENNISFTKYRK
jgi:hypothetical protein